MKKFKITVEGKTYEVEVEEIGGDNSMATSISAPQPSAPKAETKMTEAKPTKNTSSPKPKPKAAAVSGEEVTAPMPGKVLQLKVKEGDSVKEGDTLLILEAMKMENEIVANASGSVKKVDVAVNDMVDSGDVLIVIG
ncbi:MAG: biotin/lipoyl-containing protein [Candidatus Caldatribacteriota bacterium]|nr:biotin/lipoyl-containing protein [Candidatus Caldatribacteriota bacterium]